MVVVKVDLDRRLGTISRKVYGMFIEHLERCIYGGLFEPGSPLADENGFRRDVLEAARRLQVPILRYPGGNFASAYHWLDGVGPREHRPARPDAAWKVVESNEFGTNEFLQYCRLLGAEPFLCANLGSGSMEEAAAWVEYCNREVGTSYANLRAEHGFPQPHRVTYWNLGNEIYGDWQIGHRSAQDYAKLARECAKLMKRVDPTLQLVLCGGQEIGWDREVLEKCIDVVEHISYHFYWGPVPEQDPHYSTLAQPYCSELYWKFLWQLIEQTRRERKVTHPVKICIDEWNTWATAHPQAHPRDRYDLTDALSVAIYLNAMRRNCHAIEIATLAQMVNVIAPIVTSPEGMFLQTIFYPLLLAVEGSGPIALDAYASCESYPAGYLGVSEVPYLDALATLDEEKEKLFLSLVNLHKEDAQQVEVLVMGGEIAASGRVHVVTGEAPEITNDFGQEGVTCRTFGLSDLGSRFTYLLPPRAHAVVEMTLV